jgi:class 3 adenylate cyclase/tetratricopeptide (TPR) repeat protein
MAPEGDRHMMDALPEGTVTILFTDVEASTALHVSRGDDAARTLLSSYEEQVRTHVREHGGVAVKSLGDGLMAAFSSARKAVACAVAIQRGLDAAARSLPGEQPRIRIGLNSGEVTSSHSDLQGVAVSAAARVAGKAGGGQILVPAVVKELAGVMPGVTFTNRGRFRLKGFPDRWQLFEVIWRQQPDAATTTALTERAAFVGRDRERSQLTAALERALNGHGELVVIGGEPGVGKTRLCEELMRDAEQRGCRVLLGHCYESEAAVPYMPFVEILEKASQVVDADVFLQALGDSAPEVARILPRLRRMFPHIAAPLELPPEQERRYLFTSIDEFLSRSAAIRPQVAVLEDVHWADESTLLLLQHLAAQLRGMRTLLLATYRDVELGVSRPLASTLETLIRGGNAQRISLRRFDAHGVTAMLRSLAGGHPPPPALVATVYRETEGNPFFVQEVFKYLAEKGDLLDRGGAFRRDLEISELDVPESLRLVIGRRLERLSDASRGILTGAAVLGRQFSYRLLELVADVPPDALLDAVDEAERAQVMTAGEGRDVSFTFSHELVRQTLLNQLSTPRRQRLHLRCADALERVLGRDVDTHIAEVAHHLFEAGGFADPARTATALRTAAERALDAAAYEDALHLLDRAAQVLSPDDAAALARINEDLGLALRGVGRHEEAMAKWESALATYEQDEDAPSVVRVVNTVATQLNWAGRQMEAVVVAARGLAVASDAAMSLDPVRLMGLSAVAFSFAGDHESGERQGTEAYELARASGDAALVASAGVWLTLHKFFWAESARAIEIGDAAAQTLRDKGAWWELCDLLGGGLIWARFFRGELDAMFAGGEECLALAHRVGHTAAEAAASRVHIVDAMRRGDLRRAADLVHRHLEVMATSGYLWAFDTYAYAAYVDFCAGDWAAARAEAEQGDAREIPCAFAGIPAAFGVLISAYLGRGADVLDVLSTRRAVLPGADGVATIGSWALAGALVEALFIVGAYDDAASLAGTAEAMAGRGAVNWVAVQLTRTTAGLAAAAAGRWDSAEEQFRGGLRDAEAMRYAPLAADARRLYATALIERGPSGRTDDACRLLGEALAAYRAMGMARHAGLTRAVLQRAG